MKNKEINIFDTAKKQPPITENEAINYLSKYINIIKDDKEKLSDFEELVELYFNNARSKTHTSK